MTTNHGSAPTFEPLPMPITPAEADDHAANIAALERWLIATGASADAAHTEAVASYWTLYTEGLLDPDYLALPEVQ